MRFEESEKRFISSSNIAYSKRIIIVDDEPFNLLGMQIMMDQLNIVGLKNIVDKAHNGKEALDKIVSSFNEGSHIYSLILTDISMPVMDGYELSEEVRSFYRRKKCP